MNPDLDQNPGIVSTRRLIWLYCIVWLLEGALRKWVLPGFSKELLLVRDPIALLIYLSASRARVFPMNGWLGYLGLITALIFLQAIIHIMTGDVSLAVAIFGVRTFILHMPLIWVIPGVFGRKDIVLLGKWVLIIAPFLAELMVVQFEVGPDHWLNVASLKGGAQIGSVFGKIRPPAVFSFITGPIHYFALVTAFVVGGVLTKKLYPPWLLAAGAVSVLMAMSVSASRSLVLGCILVAVAGGAGSLLTGKRIGAVIAMGVVLIVAGSVILSFGVMKEGIAAFTERWGSEEGSGATGGKVMTERVGGGFISAFHWAGKVPITGLGVGSSSNLAAERKDFNIGVEGEWERVIYEIGPITGFLYLGFRAALALRVLMLGFGAVRSDNFMCILFGAACFFDVMTGNIRQVTSYGYIAVCAGLCIAAHRAFSGDEEVPIAEQVEDIMQEKPKARGRGRFAVGGAPVRS
jgi:hypothetical protein